MPQLEYNVRWYLLDGSRGAMRTGTGAGGSGSDAPDVVATGSEELSESASENVVVVVRTG